MSAWVTARTYVFLRMLKCSIVKTIYKIKLYQMSGFKIYGFQHSFSLLSLSVFAIRCGHTKLILRKHQGVGMQINKLQQPKNNLGRGDQKALGLGDLNCLGRGDPNCLGRSDPNFLVAATQIFWVLATQIVWVVATQILWVSATQIF